MLGLFHIGDILLYLTVYLIVISYLGFLWNKYETYDSFIATMDIVYEKHIKHPSIDYIRKMCPGTNDQEKMHIGIYMDLCM